MNSPILETGVVTNIELKSGGYLTLNDSLAIPLILDSAATLQINHSSGVDFYSVHPYANIIYNTINKFGNPFPFIGPSFIEMMCNFIIGIKY